MSAKGVISDALSVRQARPLCPWFRTYCCLAANDVQGQYQTSSRLAQLVDLDQCSFPLRREHVGFAYL